MAVFAIIYTTPVFSLKQSCNLTINKKKVRNNSET